MNNVLTPKPIDDIVLHDIQIIFNYYFWKSRAGCSFKVTKTMVMDVLCYTIKEYFRQGPLRDGDEIHLKKWAKKWNNHNIELPEITKEMLAKAVKKVHKHWYNY